MVSDLFTFHKEMKEIRTRNLLLVIYGFSVCKANAEYCSLGDSLRKSIVTLGGFDIGFTYESKAEKRGIIPARLWVVVMRSKVSRNKVKGAKENGDLYRNKIIDRLRSISRISILRALCSVRFGCNSDNFTSIERREGEEYPR